MFSGSAASCSSWRPASFRLGLNPNLERWGANVRVGLAAALCAFAIGEANMAAPSDRCGERRRKQRLRYVCLILLNRKKIPIAIPLKRGGDVRQNSRLTGVVECVPTRYPWEGPDGKNRLWNPNVSRRHWKVNMFGASRFRAPFPGRGDGAQRPGAELLIAPGMGHEIPRIAPASRPQHSIMRDVPTLVRRMPA